MNVTCYSRSNQRDVKSFENQKKLLEKQRVVFEAAGGTLTTRPVGSVCSFIFLISPFFPCLSVHTRKFTPAPLCAPSNETAHMAGEEATTILFHFFFSRTWIFSRRAAILQGASAVARQEARRVKFVCGVWGASRPGASHVKVTGATAARCLGGRGASRRGAAWRGVARHGAPPLKASRGPGACV